MSSGSESRPPVADPLASSTAAKAADSAQLSGSSGVNSGVSSVALKQAGFAGLGGTTNQAPSGEAALTLPPGVIVELSDSRPHRQRSPPATPSFFLPPPSTKPHL